MVRENKVFTQKLSVKSANHSIDRLTDNSLRHDCSVKSTCVSNRRLFKILKQIGNHIDILLSKTKNARRLSAELQRMETYKSLLIANLKDKQERAKLKFNKSRYLQEKDSLQAFQELYQRLLLQVDEGQTNVKQVKDFYTQLVRELKTHILNFTDPEPELIVSSVLKKSRSSINYQIFKDNDEISERKDSKENFECKIRKMTRMSKSFDIFPFREKVESDYEVEKFDQCNDFQNYLNISKIDQVELNPQNENLHRVSIKGVNNTLIEVRQRDYSDAKVTQFSFSKPISNQKHKLLKVQFDLPPSKSHSNNEFRLSVSKKAQRTNSFNSKVEDFLQSNVAEEKRTVLTTREFYKSKLKSDAVEEGLTDTKEKPQSVSSDVPSVTSSIGSSILEEIQEEIYEKFSFPDQVTEQNSLFSSQKVKPKFIPIKISFIIGIQENSLKYKMTDTKERIYKSFEIREMIWHLKEGAIVGLQMYFYNNKDRFYLQGKLHGVEGDRTEKFILKPREMFNKLEFINDEKQILLVKLSTNLARNFKTGKDKKALLKNGHRLISRYFPKEVKLCKFFSSFDPQSQRLVNLRFMYVRTVFY
jgi:hypothetical protein